MPEQVPGGSGPLILIRFSGDISTKGSKTKQRFVRRLEQNLHDALVSSGIGGTIRRDWHRLYLEAESPLALDVVPRVFGVQSLSPVERRPWTTLDDVVREGEAFFREDVAGKRFAVRARRGGDVKRIPFNSMDVDRALGTALLPGSAGVDLGRPEFTARLEIQPEGAYFFRRVVPAHGGLPLGVEGRALALVSGGFDSAVASWLMLRRGVSLDYLFLNLGGSEHRNGVLRVMKVVSDLWSYGDRPILHELDFVPVVRDLRERTAPRFWQVILKRLMLRVGERLAGRVKAHALVTGEAVGQVSSQTLQNLAVISRATEIPILRPLVGNNKEEITERARRIGTFESSAKVDEYCDLVSRSPSTNAPLRALEAEEAKLDPAVLRAAWEGRRKHDLRALEPGEVEDTDLDLGPDRIPPDAVLLDLRSRPAYDAWHPAGALHLEYAEALRAYRAFARDKAYVLYCEIGYKSAHLAELMRKSGFRAWHLHRGVRELMERSQEADLLLR
jgi:thiamine biosynthesis protein ThiI